MTAVVIMIIVTGLFDRLSAKARVIGLVLFIRDPNCRLLTNGHLCGERGSSPVIGSDPYFVLHT